MELEDSDDLILRLKKIEGQVRGLQRMVEEKRDCQDIITQLLAVRAGLDQAGLQLITTNIHDCLSAERVGDEQAARSLEQAIRLWVKLG